ncbi:uncharacterized protein LOC118442011 isoform X2 [Vespa mandarinia]|uniref:uncharacterized protein LOC118442011 isoform X2 n=1 Tax=Vespa mandarinia TaxID=7446 RepID=UPI00160FA185|nr:uncharacterized protein LOC118442011 isoform X2 [Vespa mandarinia]XP_046832144.1 uncharacterized protein LOC124430085 isoform X2 [Vespa crabro]
MANRMKALYNQVIFERRILLGCTTLVGLSACIWAVAIGTDHWFTVEAPNDEGLPLGDSGASGRRLIYKHMGLWRGCVSGLIPKMKNSSELVPYSECKYQEMFPPESKFDIDPGLDRTVITACNMVVIQVLLSSVDYESTNVYETFPKGAIMRYDFSLILAWIVFLCNLIAGCAFMLFSRKRKRDKAPTEEIAMADEPTIIGR